MKPEPDARIPTGRRRPPSRADANEEAILDAAYRLLACKPVADITVDEIAAGAGIARSSFYRYFQSRDAVIRAPGETVAAELTAGVDAALALALGAPIEDAVRGMVAASVVRWRAKGPLLRAMSPFYEHDVEHRRFWDTIRDAIEDKLVAWIEAERARGSALPGPPDARSLTRALVAMLWRVGYDVSLSPESPEDDAKIVDAVAAVWVRAVWGAEATR